MVQRRPNLVDSGTADPTSLSSGDPWEAAHQQGASMSVVQLSSAQSRRLLSPVRRLTATGPANFLAMPSRNFWDPWGNGRHPAAYYVLAIRKFSAFDGRKPSVRPEK